MKNEFVNSLQKIWKTIEKDYKENRINSEHALQCDMYRLLREYTDEEELVILVEPTLFVKYNKRFSPDLVIIKNKSIKYIIELKYAEGYVAYKKDWDKFNRLQKQTKVKVKRNKSTKTGGEKFNVNVKHFIFAYIDHPILTDGGVEGATNTNEKVLKLINSRKNSAWMKTKYIQFHGHISRGSNESICWEQTYPRKK